MSRRRLNPSEIIKLRMINEVMYMKCAATGYLDSHHILTTTSGTQYCKYCRLTVNEIHPEAMNG